MVAKYNQHNRAPFAVLLLGVFMLGIAPISAFAVEGGNRSCFDDWECTEWGPCIDNMQTRECTFECTVEPCLEISTAVRACEMPKLTIYLDKDEARFGETVQISVIDEDGRQVAADLQVTRPDGCMIALSQNQYTIEQDGLIMISADSEGYYGAQTQALGYGAPKPQSPLSEPMFYVLLFVVLLLIAYLIWRKARKKSGIERL